MKLSARFLSIILIGFVSLLSITTPVFAQTLYQTAQVNPYTHLNTDPDVPKDFHTFTQVIANEAMLSMICQLIGIDPTRKDMKCIGIDTKTGKFGFVNGGGGLIGMTMRGIAVTYQMPIHTSGYVHYLADNFGLYQKTYAATAGNEGAKKNGVGFTGLEPLLTTWVAFRNIVYLVFIIAFILVGVGVMLRIQIDPRTVMTIENMLPKIVIGLILVTFSYAIAGILVDFMWLVTFLVINVMHSVDVVGQGAAQIQQKATINLLVFPYMFLDAIWQNGVWGMIGGLDSAFYAVIGGIFTAPWSQNGAQITNGINSGCSVNIFNLDWGCLFSTIFTTVLNIVFTVIVFALGWLVFFITILIVMIRVWISLLKAYIGVILAVIFAPFYIVAGIIPGSTLGFGGWIRTMAANLLAFPAVVFMLLLARVMNDNFGNSPGGGLFIPPLIGNPNGPYNPLGALISFGIILITPEAVNLLRKIFNVEDSGLGGAAMGAFMAGPRFATNATKNIGGAGIDYFTGRNPIVPKGVGAVMRGFFGR